MSMLESTKDVRPSRQRRQYIPQTGRPGQPRESETRQMKPQGFAAHDDFRVAGRRPGLAILEYEEGESI